MFFGANRGCCWIFIFSPINLLWITVLGYTAGTCTGARTSTGVCNAFSSEEAARMISTAMAMTTTSTTISAFVARARVSVRVRRNSQNHSHSHIRTAATYTSTQRYLENPTNAGGQKRQQCLCCRRQLQSSFQRCTTSATYQTYTSIGRSTGGSMGAQSNTNVEFDEQFEMNEMDGDQNDESILNDVKLSLYNDILPIILQDQQRRREREREQENVNQTPASTESTIVPPQPSPTPVVILLAVSGGCDSIALFHSILHVVQTNRNFCSGNGKGQYKNEIDEVYVSNNNDKDKSRTKDYGVDSIGNDIECELDVHVVHFDHEQRGEESDKDREFVQKLCQEYDVPFHCFYWGGQDNIGASINNVGNEPKLCAKFSQEAARDWRRRESLKLLQKICLDKKNNNSSNNGIPPAPGVIFTAHHKDDAEETMIMKFLRGVHITNLSGMDPVQHVAISSIDENLQPDPQLYLGKPMLRLRKSSIYNFLSRRGLSWREDASNQTDKYLRNKVRHQLMPLLKDLVGGEEALASRLQNLEEQSLKVRDDISSRASSYLEGSPSYHFPLPPNKKNGDGHGDGLSLVEEEALHQWIRRESKNSVTVSYEKVTMIAQQLSMFPDRLKWKISLGGKWYVVRTGDVLELKYFTDNCIGGQHSNEQFEENANNWIIEQNGRFDDNFENENGQYLLSLSLKYLIHDNQSVEYSIRNVEGNEHMRIVPPWRSESASGVKIKEFLRGQKIPLHRRGAAPILCIETDDAVYIGAVFVDYHERDKPSRWITNRIFTPQQDVDESELHQVLIKRKA